MYSKWKSVKYKAILKHWRLNNKTKHLLLEKTSSKSNLLLGYVREQFAVSWETCEDAGDEK